MIHLSKFLIGIRHKRVFRVKNLTGEIIDNILEECPKKFTKVAETRDREELILIDDKGIVSFRANKDDIILESTKIFDREADGYIEISKKDLSEIADKCLPIVSDTLSLQDDFNRIGMIFEFRIPRWDNMKFDNFVQLIHNDFMKYSIPLNGEISESSIRFAYKLKAPGGAVIKKLKDYRNVIIRVEDSVGIDESGVEQKCLFISVDIQHYFDPKRTKAGVSIREHYNFACEHLKSTVIPEFKSKGIEIIYE